MILGLEDLDDILLDYSEWLDKEGLILNDKEPNDSRCHEQLVRDFIAWSNSQGVAS